jgi:hypothetical protein
VSTSNNTLTFSGTLYRTTGPPFTLGSFNAGQVSLVRVGTIAFSAPGISAATPTYVIDGQSYAKSIQPETWANARCARAG